MFDEYVDSYEAACERGLRLAGEKRAYFARQRVQHTLRRCAGLEVVRAVVDFGCGLGHTVPYLLESFPHARIFGVDNAVAVIQAASKRYGNPRAEFVCGDVAAECRPAQLVYCNGVFHHIPPAQRKAEAQKIFDWLGPRGLFALWENNPWNPGTRLVMRRIPFDRDAVPLSYREAERLLRAVGFRILGTSFHFYFPSPLKSLRWLEPWLQRVPFGAQYCVLAQKPL
jgi:SAM-dependent methyltransferase